MNMPTKKLKIKKGDRVLVITGKDRNKTGKVERVLPKTNRVLVEGVNILKKHLKRSSQNPAGGIIERATPIHISNVMLLDPSDDKPTRAGYKITSNQKVRIAKKSGEEIK